MIRLMNLLKVLDFTYTRGDREELSTDLDIGIASECLAECINLGEVGSGFCDQI